MEVVALELWARHLPSFELVFEYCHAMERPASPGRRRRREQALPGLRGLLRTVRVPEFAGVIFHEVEAKSALNRVPGDSPMPFRWTVNPYRGCGHACVYCLAGATRVLLADGRTRPIADLRAGDAVLGTAVDAVGVRRYVPTPVLAHWSTTKPAHRVTLADGTTLVASGEHRFLTRRRVAARGARVVPGRAPPTAAPGRRPARSGCAARSPRPHRVLPAGLPARPGPRGHGGRMRVRDGRIDQAFPSERLELEALGRAHHLLAVEAADHGRPRAGAPASQPPARAGSLLRRRLVRVGAAGPDGTAVGDAEWAARAVPPPGIGPGRRPASSARPGRRLVRGVARWHGGRRGQPPPRAFSG